MGKKMSLEEQLAIPLGEFKLLSTRVLVISEAITSEVAKRVLSHLILLSQTEEKKRPIVIYLNSPGGEVTSGLSIYDAIRFIEAPVKIIATGLCASIATIIHLSVPKPQRYAMPHCKFLIHQPLIMGRVFGQASDIEITAKDIIKTRKRLNRILSQECEQPLEKVESDTTRDYWMTAEEAMEYGLIGKIVASSLDV